MPCVSCTNWATEWPILSDFKKIQKQAGGDFYGNFRPLAFACLCVKNTALRLHVLCGEGGAACVINKNSGPVRPELHAGSGFVVTAQ